MKRSLSFLTRIILFLCAFMLAVYIFIPWRECGKFALSMGHDILQRRGMRLNYSDVTGGEGRFTADSLKLSGMADISLSSVTIKPDIPASILTLSPVCRISFKGCNIRLGQTMNFGDGEFLLTYGREILIEDLRTKGEFSLRGYITIDTSAMKIGRADALLEVPETFSQNMNMIKNFLPLVEEGGRWYLRRK